MSAVFKVHGQINKVILEKVLKKLFLKYEILRTNFVQREGACQQIIASEKQLHISIDELFASKKEMVKIIHHCVNASFNLQNDTLLRIGLLHRDDGQSFLMFTTHHIIMDGWSLEVLIKEVIKEYQAFLYKEELADEPLPFQFKDYAAWYQNQKLKTAEANQVFWKTYLKDNDWESNIPFDDEFSIEKNKGATFVYDFASLEIKLLNDFTKDCNISLHTLLLGAFNLLVYKMYDRKDICTGMLNAGRAQPELQNQLGMFVQTLPFRTIINSDWSFKDFLTKAHQDILEIDEHQDFPDDLQKNLKFSTIFTLENPSLDYHSIELAEEVRLEKYPFNNLYSRLPMLVQMNPSQDFLSGTIDYNLGSYESATIELLCLKFEKLLQEGIKYPDKSIRLLNIDLEIEQKNSIDISFNF